MWKKRGIRVGASVLAVVFAAGLLVSETADPAQAGLLGGGGGLLGELLPTLTSISVSPSTATITQGQTLPFTATGTLSNGATENLTSLVTWSASPGEGLVATLSNLTGSQGVATAGVPGTSTITALAPTGLLGLTGLLSGVLGGGLSGSAVLTVISSALPGVLSSISVSPSTASIIPGQTLPFSATGLLSNGTTQDVTNLVTWSSSAPGLASLGSTTGLATGLAPGTSTITALAPAGLLGLLTPLLSTSSLLTVLSSGSSTLSPLLSLNPPTGKVRTGVLANGANFVPGSPVTVSYLSGLKARKRASTVLCTATVASNGTFSCGGKIPRRGRSGKRGHHTVVATVPSTPNPTTTTFNLIR